MAHNDTEPDQPAQTAPETTPKRRAALSITLLAPLALALPVVVVALVFSALGLAQSRASTDELASRIVNEIDARVRDRVLQLTGLAAKVSKQNAYLVELGVYDTENLPAWLPTMQRQIDIFEGLSGIAWGDTQGRATWLVDYPDQAGLEYVITSRDNPETIDFFTVADDGSLTPEPDKALEYDPRVRPWYLTGAHALGSEAGAAWSDAYSWVRADGTGATLGISYARPITDSSGNLLGVIDTELELQSVSKFLQTLEVGETGTAFLLDGSNLLIASGYGEPLVDAQLTRLEATRADNDITRAAAIAATAQLGNLAELDRPARFLADNVAGQPAWIGVTPITADGLRWTLVTIVPEADLTARVDALRRRTFTAAAALVLITLLLGMVLARLAVRPIVALRDHVHRVGEGDLDRRLDLRATRELADLSNDVNTMTDALLDRAKLQESLRLAMEVQQALLPDGAPEAAGLEIAGFSEYCDETGGDYYDFLAVTEASEHRLGIALGDVMGHGIAAALLMASARAVLRSRATDPEGSLAEHLQHVNTQLTQDTGGSRFMTMLLMIADGRARTLEWSTAGQHSGLLYRADTDDFTELEGTGLPLGIVADAEYDQHKLTNIAPGSILLITTDGLFESSNPDDEQYGFDRIRDSLRRHRHEPAEELTKALYDELIEFCGETPPDDDVTFIVVRFTA